MTFAEYLAQRGYSPEQVETLNRLGGQHDDVRELWDHYSVTNAPDSGFGTEGVLYAPETRYQGENSNERMLDSGGMWSAHRDRVSVDGQDWMRTGFDPRTVPDPKVQAILSQFPDAIRNDPAKGWLLRNDAAQAIAPIYVEKHKGGDFDFMADALGFAAMTPFIMGAPGIDGLLGQFGNIPNPFGGAESWGVNARSGMTALDLANIANPQNLMQMSIPGISTAGTSGLIPGAASGISSIADLQRTASTNSANAVASGGAAASGGLLSNLLTPKNLLNAGLNLGSALLQRNAVGDAVDAQTGAADRATAASLAMYNQNREDLAPWRNAGGGAVKRLSDMLTPGNQTAALQMDPGYQWRMDQGTQAIDRSAAARGRLFSPGTMNAVQRYGQNFASNEFTNATNRLSNLAGLGQTAATNTANAGQNAVTQQNANTIGAGNARASGYVGGANAVSGALSNFLRGMQEDQILKSILGGSY